MENDDGVRDRRLIARVREGDGGAFEALVEPWRGRLVGYLARMSGDRDQTDDLVQETLVRAWKGLRSYDDRTRFGSWLFTIAHHVTVDHFRRSERSPATGGEVPDDLAVPADPSHAYLARELGALLAGAVAGLPEAQRRVFLLRQLGTLKFREIAELTGEPLSTVLGHMSYATKKLQRIVRNYHERSTDG